MKSLILHHHLGLGDHFVCNGLVHKISEQYDLIYLPCKNHNFETVKYLYSESPRIEVFKIKGEEHREVKLFSLYIDAPILRVGFDKCDSNDWEKSFYRQVDVDFCERYNSFRVPKNLPDDVLKLPDKKYLLVHNQSSENFDYKIDIENKNNYELVYVKKVTNNIFSYLNLLNNAEEIHCVPSSFYCLVDGMFKSGSKKLFYHDIRINSNQNIDKTKWKIINYKNRR